MNLAAHRTGNIEFVRGNDEQFRSQVSIDDALKLHGAWYVLLRVHDSIWRDRDWPFLVRYEAGQILWSLCNQVAYFEGKK